MRRYILPLIAVLALAGSALATTTFTAPTTTEKVTSIGTNVLPDETAPANTTDGFNVQPGYPYIVTVKAVWTQSLVDAGIANGFFGDAGCILDGFDGGCVYPQSVVPDDAGVNIGPRTVFGKGALRAYRFNPSLSSWSREPNLDLYVIPGATEQTFSVTSAPATVGRIAYQPYGIHVPVKVYVVSGQSL